MSDEVLRRSQLANTVRRIQKAAKEAVRFLEDMEVYPASELEQVAKEARVGISSYSLADEIDGHRVWLDDMTLPAGKEVDEDNLEDYVVIQDMAQPEEEEVDEEVDEEEVVEEGEDDLKTNAVILLMSHVAYYDDQYLTALMVHCFMHAMGGSEMKACYWMNQYLLLTKGESIEDYDNHSRQVMERIWHHLRKMPLNYYFQLGHHATWFRLERE